MAICKCSPEYSYQPHSDTMHELRSPNKCLISDCDCQGFQDRGQNWTDTFVKKLHDKQQ
ncbi:MAG: hypothetical protein ACRD91_03855 [Nitrosopumilaceae archaeon]